MPGNLTAAAGCRLGCNVSFEGSRALAVGVYSAVCALGLPANCLTAALALREARRGSVLAVYLCGLALCELLYAGTLPLWVLYVQNQHCWTLGPWACRVTAFVFFCNLYVSSVLLCCISCDRFVAVVYALESRGRRRRRTAALLSAAAFLLVGLVHAPVFLMEDKGTCFERMPVDSEVARYYYSRFALGFAVPLCVIAFTNQRIVRTVGLSEGLSAARKARVRHTAIAVVAIFLTCFAPYHLVLLLKAAAFSYYGSDEASLCRLEARVSTVSVAFLCLATVNSVADPIIYVLATDHSRREVSRIRREWTMWSAKTDAAKLTRLKDSEERPPPVSLTSSCLFPRPAQPRRAQPGTWAPLGALERPREEPC
ncbi:probable G-protein coupled receptor 132 [Myotis myotis]|uniref:G protein-coupled receptor 132 n=1 Tax=Myotis myotis TaxID=51298 RepID=A0A7J7R1U8_MYOMY|nr:probable G-protein coupled receptor 132 [Myotis myotis]KAF6269935.1 G protein-coupled receptor 132 [Myotis myotis]